MRTILISLLLLSFAACAENKPAPKAEVPADSDLKADIVLKGSGQERTIEMSFYFSKPVAAGEKTAPPVDVIAVDEPTFNGTALTQGTSEAGRVMYSASGVQVRYENIVSLKLNGKQYEGKAVTQNAVPNRSVTIVMVPK